MMMMINDVTPAEYYGLLTRTQKSWAYAIAFLFGQHLLECCTFWLEKEAQTNHIIFLTPIYVSFRFLFWRNEEVATVIHSPPPIILLLIFPDTCTQTRFIPAAQPNFFFFF